MNPRSLPADLKTAERKLKHLDLMDMETKIPDTEDYYERMHNKIMARIEQVEIQPPPPALYRAKGLLKRQWRNGLFLITMSALALVVGVRTIESANTQLNNNHAVVKFKNEDQLVGLLKNSPDVLDNTVLSSYANQDLMSDDMYSNIDLTKEVIDSM